MRWLMVVFVVGCGLYDRETCEPIIEYDHAPTLAPPGCHNLEFYEISIPDSWYPVGTRARVDECKPREGQRLFDCMPDGSWRELFLL